MKRFAVAVLAIVAATVPATSTAGASGADAGAAARGGNNLQITFVVRSVDGEPRKIREFKFDNLTTACNQGGPVDVRGQLDTMRVNDAGKFDGNARKDGGKVHVEGVVKNGGDVVKGTIRASGKFLPARGCDSGHVEWKAELN